MTETHNLHHSFDAKLAKNIGEQSVSSSVQAVIELIKNSFDADALNCKVHFYADAQRGNNIKMTKIVIEDNGFGMTFEDFEEKWMRVATTHKEREQHSPILGRRVSGEKGMGRFASQRLGNIVKIISNPEDYVKRRKTAYSYNTLELIIDWNKYVAGKNFEEIDNKLRILDKKEENSGVRIEITDLKDQWNLDDLDAIVVNAGTLVSPRVLKESDDNSFDVEIIPHGFTPLRTKIESVVEKYAPWQINAQLIGSKVNYQIFHRSKSEEERIPVVNLSKRAKGRNELPVGSKTCGNVKLELLIYEGRPGSWAPKSVQKFKELQDQLEENSGIKIFNDGIRIMPYGKKGNDWVGLDKRYLKRAGGPEGDKVRNRNIVGYVFFTRKNNPEIKETTTREGLVENSEFKFLKERLLIDVLKEFENYRKEWEDAEKASRPKTRPAAQAESTIMQLTDFVESLDIKKADKHVIEKLATETTKHVEKQEEEKKKEVDKVTSNLEMYRNLASLGISALAFHHEIRQAIGRISQRQTKLNEKWNTWDDAKKLDYVSKTILDISTVIDLNSYIREFAALFSGLQGTKKSREEIRFTDSIDRFVEGFQDILEEFGIEIEIITGPGRLTHLYMNRASWESIMLNLMSNSIKALGNVQRRKKFVRIFFEKTTTNLKIEVRDNGSGIQESNFERVFDPLWTTYRTAGDSGTGMGTTIVREIVEDDYGGIVKVKSSKFEKDYPGKGETTIQILIPLENLKEQKS
jgi:signal transduction histidine kinase